MTNKIIKKLNEELSILPINTEPRMVYILVQIRKLLEDTEDKINPLHFYCNWVVHARLHKGSAQQKLGVLSEMSDSQISKFTNLSELRKYLAAFLKVCNLNDDLIKTEKYWISFQEQLVKILIDTPIENPDGIISFFALQKRSEAPVGGTERIEYKMIKNNKEMQVSIYPY